MKSTPSPLPCPTCGVPITNPRRCPHCGTHNPAAQANANRPRPRRGRPTPPGLPPALVIATPSRRLAAFAIDEGIVAVIGIGALVLGGPWWCVALMFQALCAALLWQTRAGLSCGKAILGLRTIDVALPHAPMPGRAALRLGMLAAASGAGGIGAWLVEGSGGWDRTGRGQGWHDRIAHTLVIDLRATLASARPRPNEVFAPRLSQSAGARIEQISPTMAVLGVPSGGASSVPSGAERAPVGAGTAQGGTSSVPDRASSVPDGASSVPDGTSSVPGATETVGIGRVTTMTGGTAMQMPRPAAVSPAPPAMAPVPAGFRPDSGMPMPAPVPAPPAPSAMPTAPVPTPPVPNAMPTAPVRPVAGPPQPSESASAEPVYTLVFDSGERVVVRGCGVIGREPTAAGRTLTHLLALPDSRKSVSKNHALFEIDSHGFWLTDLGSTNRTVIQIGEIRVSLAASERAAAPRGAIVHLGFRSFTIT